MNKSILITGLAAAVALSAPVYAGSQQQDKTPTGGHAATRMQPEKGAAYGADADAYEYGFQNMDRNKDGYVSREEASEHDELAQKWDEADTNHDGKLDESEFSAFEDSDPDSGGSGR